MIDQIQLEKDIKSKNLKNNYIFIGHNEHLMKEYIENIKKISLNELFVDLNYNQFDGMKLQISDVINSCKTLPCFDETRVVSIFRANALKNPREKEGKELLSEIKDYLLDISPSTIFIITIVFDNKRDKVPYEIKKLEKDLEVVEFKAIKGDLLVKLIKKTFKDKKYSIGNSEAAYLGSCLEGNIDIINNEVEKLINYCNGREVTTQDIKLLVPPVSENDIFNLVDNISKREVREALNILSELINRGEKEQIILYMILRQFRLLYKIKSLCDEGYNYKTASKALKLNEFVAQNLYRMSSKYTFPGIERIIMKILEADKSMKTGRDYSLESLLIQIISIK